MQPSMPRQALDVVVRLGRSKRRAKSVVSQTSNEEMSEAALSPVRTDNNEIRILDDNFAEQYHDEARDHQPMGPIKKRVMLRFGGDRRAFAHRRHQLMLWKGQAASNAVKALRGCYALARQEVTAWRSRSKVATDNQTNETKTSSRPRVSSIRKSLKRPRTNSLISTASSASIVSSLSSTIELEEERYKELFRSNFSLHVQRSSSLEMKTNTCGFAETINGGHERLLLVNALSLNDSDDGEGDCSSISPPLPFRSTVIDGRVRVLRNEWV